MFSVGDTVVHPAYGAGMIVDIETVQVSGKTGTYYVIDLPDGNLKVRLSVEKADEVGLRDIYDQDRIIDYIESVKVIPIDNYDNWNQRYKDNLEKLKTGKFDKAVEVYRNLYLREHEKGLSGAEKKMLNNIRHIVVSEIVISCGMEKHDAENYLVETIFG
ncbi:MAG: CarD family transcriptional regulator [Firmicutes bacterium]|nr:CarD family transcriptional regulator [Bacillota bacterium]